MSREQLNENFIDLQEKQEECQNNVQQILVDLQEKQEECQKNAQQISTLRQQLVLIQEQELTEVRDQQQKNKQARSKKKGILYLENFKIDIPLYTPFYTEYCKNTKIIPLFSKPFTVKKYKLNNENIEVMNDITRNINIFYNLKNKMFEVKYYDYDKAGNFKLNTLKSIKSINEIIGHNSVSNTYVFTLKNKIYGHDTNNVVEVSNNIKKLLQYFNQNLETFTSSIGNFDKYIKDFIKRNNEYFININNSINSISFLSEVPFDINYNKLTKNNRGVFIKSSFSFKNESLYNFFIINNKIYEDHYDKLSETFPKPIEYYIKMRIAQTLFSDLPSNFKYDDDKKKRLSDYNRQQVEQLIAEPNYRLDQDKLKFTGNVDNINKTIDAILISSYSDKDELYIVDDELNVYTLVDSEQFVSPAAEAEAAVASVAEAAEPAVEPAAEPPAEGGKRSRRKRRKISKKKKIKTRINKKSSRIKKTTRKRVKTRKR